MSYVTSLRIHYTYVHTKNQYHIGIIYSLRMYVRHLGVHVVYVEPKYAKNLESYAISNAKKLGKLRLLTCANSSFSKTMLVQRASCF